jgi:hypothetical protein
MTETQTTTAEAKPVTSTLESIKQRYEALILELEAVPGELTAHFHQAISHAQLAFAAAKAHFKQIEDKVETEVSAIPSSFTLEGVKDAAASIAKAAKLAATAAAAPAAQPTATATPAPPAAR